MTSLSKDNQFEHTRKVSLIEKGSIKVAHIPQFLPIEERDLLEETIGKGQKHFRTYTNEPADYDVSLTRFLDLKLLETKRDQTNLIQEVYDNLRKRIIEQLPSLFNLLDVEPFTVSDIHLAFINCPDGHYGDPHIDSGNGQYRVSILYYFHRIPKRFIGGNLELFDRDHDVSAPCNDAPLFTIDFEDNLLIAFASDTPHGVTKVQSDSINFRDNRFVATAFLSAQ